MRLSCRYGTRDDSLAGTRPQKKPRPISVFLLRDGAGAELTMRLSRKFLLPSSGTEEARP